MRLHPVFLSCSTMHCLCFQIVTMNLYQLAHLLPSCKRDSLADSSIMILRACGSLNLPTKLYARACSEIPHTLEWSPYVCASNSQQHMQKLNALAFEVSWWQSLWFTPSITMTIKNSFWTSFMLSRNEMSSQFEIKIPNTSAHIRICFQHIM